MTYHGRVENGKVVLAGEITLPEGTEVEVAVSGSPGARAQGEERPATNEPPRGTIEDEIAAIWADMPASEWERLPPDLSDNLDHYIYGTPKE